MVAFRAALGPVVMLGERCGWNGVALAGMVAAALVSDIFDGVLARRWKTDTAGLRLMDSLADTAFYLCVAAAIGMGMPAVWPAYRSGVLALLGCEGLRFGFDFVKFGKPASYHSYLAKGWGLVLATAVVVTFATQRPTMWMSVAIVLGVLSNAETLAMSLVLPVWRRDVQTLGQAWRIRAGFLRERGEAGRPAGAAIGLALTLGVAMLGGARSQAQTLQHVTYVGGTALQGNGLQGKVSVSSAETLVFDGPSKLAIAYDHVISFESAPHKVVHVGLLTEGLWRLVAPWPETKRVSLSYRDADDHVQVAVLEMSRGDEAMLVEVLKTRVPRVTRPAIPRPTNPLVRPSEVVHEKAAEH
jgi:CDP-diacylglycerol--glycerol-3-phosphate 3-phosphatidyltransferase